MPNIQQSDEQPQARVSFTVPVDFKTELDVYLAHRPGLSLREFCTQLIAERLGIPVPVEERRRAS